MDLENLIPELQDIKRRNGNMSVVVKGNGVLHTVWIETDEDGSDFVELTGGR